jgi:hypothetical protein
VILILRSSSAFLPSTRMFSPYANDLSAAGCGIPGPSVRDKKTKISNTYIFFIASSVLTLS